MHSRSLDGGTPAGQVCQDILHFEEKIYFAAIAASLFFSTLAMVFYFCCLKSRLDGAPCLAAQYFFLIGTIKVALGAFIMFGFNSACPPGCICSGFPLPLYPLAAITVGCYWLYEGCQKMKRSRAVSSEGEDRDGPIFDRVPVIELS